MKDAFKPGTIVKFKIPNGAYAVITDYCKTIDWKVPGYLGEGFYHVKIVPTQKGTVVQEDDIEVTDNIKSIGFSYKTGE